MPSPFMTAIYYRRSLAECTPYFFPGMFVTALPISIYSTDPSELVYPRLSESIIGVLVRNNIIGFIANSMLLEMSSGLEYPTNQVVVAEFVPSNRQFLSLSYVKQAICGDQYEFAASYAPPWGLYGPGTDFLKNTCLNHITSIIEQSQSLGECALGDTSIILWELYEAVNHYRISSRGIGEEVSTL